MTDPEMGTEPEAEQALDAVKAVLEGVLTHLRAGKSVDLAPLERLVERACAAVVDLPAERHAEARPKVEAVLADLDRVEALLRDRFEEGPSSGR